VSPLARRRCSCAPRAAKAGSVSDKNSSSVPGDTPYFVRDPPAVPLGLVSCFERSASARGPPQASLSRLLGLGSGPQIGRPSCSFNQSLNGYCSINRACINRSIAQNLILKPNSDQNGQHRFVGVHHLQSDQAANFKVGCNPTREANTSSMSALKSRQAPFISADTRG
jgi:hypothetical protein